MRLNWAHLELFLLLYREGSVSKAAPLIGVEQSTVSRRLASLEDQIGKSLFVRTKRGVTPTEAAHRLAPIAQDIEARVREAAALASTTGRQPEGLVRVAMPEAIADFFVLPRLSALLRAHPDLRIEISAGSDVEDLTHLEADLALRFVKPDSADLIASRVGRVEVGVLGSIQESWPEPLDISKLDWVSWKSSKSFLPEARWLAEQVGRAPRVAVDSASSIVAAVRSGLGVALLPRNMVRLFGDLQALPVPPGVALPAFDLWLVKPTIHRDNPAVGAVADWLTDLIDRYRDDPAD